LKTLMIANRQRISFDPNSIDTSVNSITVPGFVQLADVPDKVWKKNQTDQTPYGRRGPENPNHYADMDFAPNGGQSLYDLTPTANALTAATWRQYYDSIGWNTVSQRGLVPFRVWQLYKKMVEFVTQGDVMSFVAASGILAHYVGDACQPLHGSYLDDGDPFRNPDGTKASAMLGHGKGFANGVHVAYEDNMLDANVPDLLGGLQGLFGPNHQMGLVTGGQNAGFATIELMQRTRDHLKPMDLVEEYGQLVLSGTKDQAPTVLWQKFRQPTLEVIADGCRTLAMLWDSAWAEGGGNQISTSKVTEVSLTSLQDTYEKQDFLPSAALDQVDQYL
jgi:hypothetical protein